ncbi:TetR/AcrR family transcriptional regulator [Motiliproteus sp.]|uniref:TetR/AcrR family transcriptional regulator n=1 Tax=Motiliproteus sp. TaxID=1898955 RepID=UPI003BAB6FAF
MNQQLETAELPVKRKRGRPRGSNADRTILQGAAKAFADLGYHDCRVADILAASNTSRTHFYRFFKSKEEVLKRLLESEVELTSEALRNAVSGQSFSDADELFVTVIDAHLKLTLDQGSRLPALLVEVDRLPELREFSRGYRYFILELFEQPLVSMGYLKPNRMLCKAALMAAYSIQISLERADMSLEQKWQTGRRMMLKALQLIPEKAPR